MATDRATQKCCLLNLGKLFSRTGQVSVREDNFPKNKTSEIPSRRFLGEYLSRTALVPVRERYSPKKLATIKLVSKTFARSQWWKVII